MRIRIILWRSNRLVPYRLEFKRVFKSFHLLIEPRMRNWNLNRIRRIIICSWYGYLLNNDGKTGRYLRKKAYFLVSKYSLYPDLDHTHVQQVSHRSLFTSVSDWVLFRSKVLCGIHLHYRICARKEINLRWECRIPSRKPHFLVLYMLFLLYIYQLGVSLDTWKCYVANLCLSLLFLFA